MKDGCRFPSNYVEKLQDKVAAAQKKVQNGSLPVVILHCMWVTRLLTGCGSFPRPKEGTCSTAVCLGAVCMQRAVLYAPRALHSSRCLHLMYLLIPFIKKVTARALFNFIATNEEEVITAQRCRPLSRVMQNSYS